MKREQFISFFFIAALLFIVYEIFRIFSPFFKAIFWAAILAFTFYPIYTKIKNKFPKSPNSVALLMTLLVLVIVITPFTMILFNMTAQVIEFSQWVYNYTRDGRLEDLIEQIRGLAWFQKIESHIIGWEPLKRNVTEWILNTTKTIGNTTASQVGILTKNVFFIILNLFFMTFLTFIFFKHGSRISSFIYSIAPFEQETKKQLFQHIHDTLAAVIRGQLLTSLIQSLTAGIIFALLGIPLPIFFAFLIFITSLIPILGAASIWFPLSVFLFLNHHYAKALLLFFLGFLLISALDNIIKPAIIGKKTKLPYFLLFFGIMGGMKLYGIMGIFLAPVVLSLFFALIKIYREKYL